MKHISLSGIRGTPTVAKIVEDEKRNKASIDAIKVLDEEPHCFFSVDAKEDANGKPDVAEADGKWHTAAPAINTPKAAATATTGKGSGSPTEKQIISEDPFTITYERDTSNSLTPGGYTLVAFSAVR